jgi:hypothetical protein
MKKVVIFRTGSKFNLVTPKQWEKSRQNLPETAIETARNRSITDETFKQFVHLTHRKEVQIYLKEVWMGI